MPEQPGLETATEWYDDGMELELEPDMSDDDFDFDEEPGDDIEPEEETVVTTGNVPVWRLIEMSRENRFLKQELADFDTYDVLDSYGDDLGREYSH